MKKQNSEQPSFRDRPINMADDGGRKWVYAKKPKGKLFKRRTILSWIFLAFLLGAPFIKIDGHPFMLLDIVGRKFVIFGAIFWAQDTFILALLMLTFVLFIVLFTVTYGRVWCGWACPQTIFLEMVFRKIETLIEGNYIKRAKRDKGEWDFDKIWRKVLKHVIFIILSIIMTNAFLLWFTGPEKLWTIVNEPISDNFSGFFIMIIISAFFYWVYSFFREQICTMVCPYGRMQGVLLDKKSIIVAYDYLRGEPRGKKDTEGDCINCKRCVAVCPTGIDIRNGTQLECINCTACIDECDIVMKSVNKPKGLIRFDSYEGIKEGHTTIWNSRNKAYSAVLVILFSFFVYTLVTRPAVEATILRTSGTLFQEQPNNKISNLYNIKIINKTHEDKILTVKILSHEAELQMAGKSITLKNHDMFESVMILILDKKELDGNKTKVVFGVYEGEKLIETYDLTFVGP